MPYSDKVIALRKNLMNLMEVKEYMRLIEQPEVAAMIEFPIDCVKKLIEKQQREEQEAGK